MNEAQLSSSGMASQGRHATGFVAGWTGNKGPPACTQTCNRGLMLAGQRTSLQPMADRLGVDRQQLQQFTASSTWAVEPVRRGIADLAIPLVIPQAWAIDSAGFAKEGTSAPGVAHQSSGTLGKVGNCQIAVSLHVAADAASCPLNWRLCIPETRDDDCADTNEDAYAGYGDGDTTASPWSPQPSSSSPESGSPPQKPQRWAQSSGRPKCPAGNHRRHAPAMKNGPAHVGEVSGRGLSVSVGIVMDRWSREPDAELTAKVVYRAGTWLGGLPGAGQRS